MIEKDFENRNFFLVIQCNHVVSSVFCAQSNAVNDSQFISVNISFTIHKDEIDVSYLGEFFSHYFHSDREINISSH